MVIILLILSLKIYVEYPSSSYPNLNKLVYDEIVFTLRKIGKFEIVKDTSGNIWGKISVEISDYKEEYFWERGVWEVSFDVFLELTKGDSCVRKIMYKAQGDGFSRGEALLSAVKRMGWDIQLKFSDFFVLKGEVIKVSGDSVYINLGVSDGVEVGELFDVWWGKRYKGKIRVIRVGDSVSLCRIEKGSVRVGMRVSKSLSNFMVFNFMFGFGGGEAVGVASEMNFDGKRQNFNSFICLWGTIKFKIWKRIISGFGLSYEFLGNTRATSLRALLGYEIPFKFLKLTFLLNGKVCDVRQWWIHNGLFWRVSGSCFSWGPSFQLVSGKKFGIVLEVSYFVPKYIKNWSLNLDDFIYDLKNEDFETLEYKEIKYGGWNFKSGLNFLIGI
ncbi:hypothetical protein DRN73_09635 [Candidatus Pacearchaeota archaeon]|nr:MAG: hypothetical protein DRN73_09635 [Candidatus Pacearchaeota archaeon]